MEKLSTAEHQAAARLRRRRAAKWLLKVGLLVGLVLLLVSTGILYFRWSEEEVSAGVRTDRIAEEARDAGDTLRRTGEELRDMVSD